MFTERLHICYMSMIFLHISLELSKFRWTTAKIHLNSFFHRDLSYVTYRQRFFSAGHCANNSTQAKLKDNASEYVFVYLLLCSWILNPRRNISFENYLLISGLSVLMSPRVLPPPSGVLDSPTILQAFLFATQGPELLVFLGFGALLGLLGLLMVLGRVSLYM